MNLEEFINKLLDACVDIAWKLVAAIVILMVGTSLIKLVLRWMKKSKWGQKIEPTLHNFIITIVKASLYILLFATLIAVMGVPMASFVTVIASAGAAIALALQGSLSNFASGILIMIFRPIKNGEFVEVDGNSGTVIDVGIFYTTIKTPDNKHVIIPNSTITSSSTVNYSREDVRRVDINFSVAYGTDTQKVKQTLSSVIASNDLIKQTPAPQINMTEHKESGINFSLKVWCDSSDFWTVKFDILEKATKSFEENGISIPFNQVDVHIVDKK